MSNVRIVLFAAAAAALPLRASAAAGALQALAPDGAPAASCPLRHTGVNVQVSGFVARVVVTQEFENTSAEPVEALYTFPLSERAAVDAMEMRTEGRTIRGTVRRREEARRIYEAARAAGKLAGLLDQERPNVFTQTLANLMPGATVRVRLEYVEPLRFADGRFELSFPTVVGPRFVPPGMPDADRVTPPVTPKGTRTGHDIAIHVALDAGVPIEAVESALHAIDVRRDGATRARVRLRRQREIPNRDFVLRWRVAGEAVRSTWLAHRTEGDGYVTFLLVPPARVTPETAAPKELIFVIDRSGSQMGAPLAKAKETMRWILDHMHPRDTFQVISFASTTETLFERPQPASPAMIRQARAHIDALEANGGTMMADAVARACAEPADANRLRIVTFMTDGYVGNDFEVLGLVQRLRGASRWFPFGTGNATNRFLLDQMARLGGGEVEYVLLNEPGDVVAGKLWERIGSPVLTDVRVDFEGLDVVDVHPSAPADLWAERPLVIHARYRRPGRGRVVLRGFQGGRPYEQALDVTLPERHAGHAAIASMWARAKVDALMDRDLQALQSGAHPQPLEDEIVRVALAHRLLTQFTSFVAVEERVVNEGGTSRTVHVPVEMPDGVEYEGIFGADALQEAPAAPAMARVRSASKATGQSLRPLAAEAVESRRALADEADGTLDADEAGKLDAALSALLEHGPGAPGAAAIQDGWVRVRVRLRDASPETRRALEAAGLVVQKAEGTCVTGLATRAILAALARLDAVRALEAVA